MEIFLAILGLILLFLAILLIRAAAFIPRPKEASEITQVKADGERAIKNLADMIRVKSVSYRDLSLEDPAEFEKFKKLLRERYPAVNKAAEMSLIGRTGVLYHIKGKSGEKPSVFMAHYDVVPVLESAWAKPAFEGIIEDGYLWGRGTLDTKTTLLGVMESAETLLISGFVPENDIYLAFAGDEETAGESAPMIVDELERRGVVPALVLDEGGAVVEGVFPGVKRGCALIGIGEKGMLDVELQLKSSGGHASAPPPHTLVGKLSKACLEIENHPFDFQLTKPAAEMFDTLGRYSSFIYKVIFANLWCFKPLLNLMCKKQGGELNALMRTTCAFTRMEGSSAFNVLPPAAKMGANLRLLGRDSVESALGALRKKISNPEIELVKVQGNDPSRISSTSSEGYQKLVRAVSATWTEAIVSPYLMVACSDSRYYCRISENVYRFSAMALSKEERAAIHGHNERIPLDKIVTTVEFYLRLMGSC